MEKTVEAIVSEAVDSIRVDLSPFTTSIGSESRTLQAASVAKLLRASKEHGYAHAAGHGIPTDVTERLLRAARTFFEKAPPQERARVAMHSQPGSYRGFQPVYANVTQGHPDGHQALDYMRTIDNFTSPSLAPEIVEMAKASNLFPHGEIEDAVSEFITHAVRAGVAVMRAVALGMGLSTRAFEENGAFSDPFWIIRLIHYPAVERAQVGHDAADTMQSEAALGCGAHRDYGFITFVTAETNPPDTVDRALQVCDKGGHWVAAKKPVKGDFLVNFGDCLEVVSCGLFPATLHRVLRPQFGDRVSVAVFIEPNFDWVIRSFMPVSRSAPCKRVDFDGDPRNPEGFRTESYLLRIQKLQEFSCYGEYLYSKVSANFDDEGLKAI
jgi:isopenicillin N synthase-like dioxygenase